MTKYKRRDSFDKRLHSSDEIVKSYYCLLYDKLISFKGVKARISLRCVSFRYNKKLIAKLALGGKSLKAFFAMDPKDEFLEKGKYHPRDLSLTRAYKEVPTMLPIKSELATRKAMILIDYMMQTK